MGACSIAATSGAKGVIDKPWKDEDQSTPKIWGATGTGSGGAGDDAEVGGDCSDAGGTLVEAGEAGNWAYGLREVVETARRILGMSSDTR